MSACLRRFATVVLIALASVCAGVCAPVRTWEAETAHRGFAAAIEVAATEIAALSASRVREKSFLERKAASAESIRYYHADGLGSTRLLSDDTGALTDHYAYEAFGDLDTASSLQASDNGFLYTGEQLDPNSGFYYLRARYMNPSAGRFTQRDSFGGFENVPFSIHKYSYAKQSPTIDTDPSGHVTLGDITTALNSISNNAMRVVRLVDAFEKIDRTLSMVSMATELPKMMHEIRAHISTNLVGKAEPDFVNMLHNYDHAMLTLLKTSNFGRIGWELANLPTQMAKAKEFISNPANNLLIYGPTPYYMPWLPPGTRFKIGKVHLSRSSRDIILELGTAKGNKGRVIGIGHTYGSSNTGDKQWFRMDWHGVHGNEDWVDPPFHFHTTKM